MADKQFHPANNNPERPPVSLYDEPGKALLGGVYHVVIFLFTLQSLSILMFLRRRIGKRILRAWVFVATFLVLVTLGGGWIHPPFSEATGADGSLLLYAFAMALLAIYHTCIGRELTSPDIPEHAKLHTRARGDSHLMLLLGNLPRFYLPLGCSFYYGKFFQPLQVTPLPEAFVQRFAEPVLLAVLSGVFAAQGSFLGGWLGLSAISLLCVESEYQQSALDKLDDLYDQRLEARTFALIKSGLEQGGRTPAKVNGITTNGIARLSETLLQLQNERNRWIEGGENAG